MKSVMTCGGIGEKKYIYILGVTIPNSVVWATRHPGFMHPTIFVYNVQVS
jgi:hypothetical protein